MTVNTDLARVQYNGNGVTTAFAFGNRVTDAAQLAATRTVIATGVDTPLILNDPGANGYSVAGVPGSSVTVNTIAAPANGTRLTIYYNMPLTQTADYVANDPFPAETHEGALDKLTIIDQQQKDAIGRSLKFASTASTALTPLLPSVPVDGAALVWSGVLGQMVNGPLVGDISAAAANAAIATAAAAVATATAASFNFRSCGAATGTANALVLTPGAPLTSYSNAFVEFIIGLANTTEAMVANISTLGNKSLKLNRMGTKTDPAIGMFQPGMHVIAQYDGTDLVVLNAPSNSQATDIAAAATLALASTTGNFANITGTGGPITAITGLKKGERFLMRHTGVQTLTHSATLFLLNNGSNITTASGDWSEWESDGTNVYMIMYQRANGQPISSTFTTGITAPSITFSTTSGIIGTTTNGNASAGSVGEYISATIASGSAISLTNVTPANIASISLTAGDWDVNINGYASGNAATVFNNLYVSVSSVSATLNTTEGRYSANCAASQTIFSASTVIGVSLPPYRISLASTTTIYFVAQASFSVNTCSAFGIIQARRVR